MTKTVLFLGLLFLLSACNNSKSSRLFLFSSDHGYRNKWDSLLTGSSFLELRPDSSFTQDFGAYNYGRWRLADQKLYLTTQNHKTYIYQLNSLSDKALKVQFGRDKIDDFQAYDLPYPNPEKDPFSADNNQWRIKATHSESTDEIKQRLLGHLHYLEKYFAWAVDKKIETLDVTGLPTPLKIYVNGLGIKHYADLPVEWKDFFYNDADCHKADSLIKHTFRKHDIDYPKTDDDYKKFLSAFQQLQNFLQHD